MLPAAILRRAAELGQALQPPATPAEVAAAREQIAWCLGLDRIPAGDGRWRPARELPGQGYAVEVGTFEAVPGLPVPAHVYRPAGPGPHPAVVHAPGHWMENARLEPDLQTFNVGLARAGMAVLCYDPIGQGERRAGWHTHGQLAPLLAGFTSLGIMVAETRAALGVLAAREDVDGGRLAVTGASGGGFVSTFTAAIDDRVAAACICCILNTHLSQLRDAAYGTGWDGWADLCNQVPHLAATANMGTVVGVAVPRRVAVVHAIDDPPFPIEGARAVVAEAGFVYRALGEPPPPLVEVSGGHGLHPAMRSAARSALAAALGLPAPPAETPFPLLAHAWEVTHDVARAGTPQSRSRPSARLPGEALDAEHDTNPVIAELARDAAVPLRAGRRASRDALLPVREPAPHGRVGNHVPLPEGGYAQRLEVEVEPGITLDAVLLLPENWADAAPGVLVSVDEGGKAQALAGPAAAVARERGWAVLAADLRGTGESAASEFELATAAWLLDRDLLAERVHDLRSCVRMLSERYSTGQQIDKRRIAVHGAGPFGLVALLAAAVDDDIAGAVSTGFVATLEELLTESPRMTPMAFPFRGLEHFDIADLVRLTAPRPAVIAAGADGVTRLLQEVGE
jgi:cephalosporin-C deacetylase-like acetyl esterase